MNKLLIFLFLFIISSGIAYAQQSGGAIDTTKIDTMFYNVSSQYYDIDIMVNVIDGFGWSIKSVDAKAVNKENELNKLMKKYYRIGYENGWDERYKSWDSSPYLYVLSGVAVGVTGMLIWHGVK